MSGVDINVHKDVMTDMTKVRLRIDLELALTERFIASAPSGDSEEYIIRAFMEKVEDEVRRQVSPKPNREDVVPLPSLDELDNILLYLDKKYGCLEELFECSVCGEEYADELREVLGHLDDEHGWSGSDIADWLEVLDINIR